MIKFPRANPVATVAFSMKPTRDPWGGSSAFVAQLAMCLKRRGYAIRYDLKRAADLIVLIDPRTDNKLKVFGTKELAHYKREHPRTPVLHRVNECDQRKASSFMDPLLAEVNALADHTVFISEWLRDYHTSRWFDRSRSHSVIYNGADPSVFHPIGGRRCKPGETMRIVTHHWSNHPLKGFDVYEALDRLLADEKLAGFEFHVIGRWPESLKWRAAKTFPPAAGRHLAEHLRACHLYLTATRWEPCGMHHVEGAQCGLPLVYHEDSGGVVEAGKKYGVGFRSNLTEALHEARDRYDELRERVVEQMPSGDGMSICYADLIQRLIAER